MRRFFFFIKVGGKVGLFLDDSPIDCSDFSSRSLFDFVYESFLLVAGDEIN